MTAPKKCGGSPRCKNIAVRSKRGMCRKHYEAWIAINQPVDAEIVRAHINRLRAANLGYGRIAELSDCGQSTIRDISQGTRRYSYAPVARAILAVNPDVARPAKMNPIGAIRRTQAMVAHGFTEQQIGAAISVRQCNLWKYVQGTASWVRPATHDRIDAAFQTLCAQPMPAGWVPDRARRRAQKRGYVPAFAWGDDIDDPAAVPDLGAILKPSRSVPADQLLEIVADHREHVGRTDAEIAAALGIKLDTLQTRIRRIERCAS
ncbi:hypothetical protein H7J86_26080 [Mycobacterium hackensackense]|uniref:hypothetical protein n=1 Tax=Mycobacterium hackensackense TaxID=228909 RepID=UPI002265DDBE|nr:hypothetical protein [Mycobacterium hackensackense]MCV7255637.1 hypothetical protein [Mycobacterium hackensackense]